MSMIHGKLVVIIEDGKIRRAYKVVTEDEKGRRPSPIDEDIDEETLLSIFKVAHDVSSATVSEALNAKVEAETNAAAQASALEDEKRLHAESKKSLQEKETVIQQKNSMLEEVRKEKDELKVQVAELTALAAEGKI